MTYEFPGSGKLDPFTLGMMRDVLKDHLTVKKNEHGSGYCCQVAASYERKVAEHEKTVAGRKEAAKAGAPVFSPASVRQGNYVRSLARRIPLHLLSPEHRLIVERAQAQNEVEKTEASQVIDAMKSLLDLSVAPKGTSSTRQITPAQLGFLKKLLASRKHDLTLDLANLADLPFEVASQHITDLKALPYKDAEKDAKAKETPARYIPAEGVYVVEDTFYKVIVSERTGNTTARKWDDEMEKWEYVGQAPFRILTEDKKATALQASAFGELYHRCVFCTKQLTREESETAGYGPVCAEKNGLPWG